MTIVSVSLGFDHSFVIRHSSSVIHTPCICGGKLAESRWLDAHENILQARSHGTLAIISRPGRKRLELEIACRSRSDSSALIKEFGGRIEALPRNWLKRFARGDSRPIKIGKRLMILRSITEVWSRSVRYPQRSPHRRARLHAPRIAHASAHIGETQFLLIPASVASGTGEHATTTMALRLLEKLTRHWKRGWSVVDLGTGSGILALAARRFGAGRVEAIDVDPTAISIAESNARLNQIHGVIFRIERCSQMEIDARDRRNHRKFG